MCLPIRNRLVSQTFYTALGFATVGGLGDDGLPEPLQFEISVGLRVMPIPSRGFGWVIGDRKRSPRDAHECLVVIGPATDAAVDKLVRRAQDAGAEIVIEAGNQKWGYAGAFADPATTLVYVDGPCQLDARIPLMSDNRRSDREHCPTAPASRRDSGLGESCSHTAAQRAPDTPRQQPGASACRGAPGRG